MICVAMTTQKNYLLRALSISMTTRTDRAIVLAAGASNILQSIPANLVGSAGHCMWWVCERTGQVIPTRKLEKLFTAHMKRREEICLKIKKFYSENPASRYLLS